MSGRGKDSGMQGVGGISLGVCGRSVRGYLFVGRGLVGAHFGSFVVG